MKPEQGIPEYRRDLRNFLDEDRRNQLEEKREDEDEVSCRSVLRPEFNVGVRERDGECDERQNLEYRRDGRVVIFTCPGPYVEGMEEQCSEQKRSFGLPRKSYTAEK